MLRQIRYFSKALPKQFDKPQPIALPKEQQAEFEKLQALFKNQTGKKHPDAAQPETAEYEGNKNPITGEVGGPTGKEPTRYGGEWERNGRVYDF